MLKKEDATGDYNSRQTTSENRESLKNINMGYYMLILTLLAGSLLYALYQNLTYVTALTQIVQRPSFSYTPVDFGGLPQAILGALQILILGTLLARIILPDVKDRLLLKVTSLSFGFMMTGLVVTVLADTQTLYLWTVETILLSLILVLLVVERLRFKEFFVPWLRSLLSVWRFDISALTRYERAVIAVIGVVTFFVYYDAIMFPIAETDAIIYHASAAAIAFYNHGMPLIDGAGVGLGSSANYPLLFSYLGTYFYLFAGGVKDVYLRAITPTMWLLSIITTYIAGRKVGGRRVGLIAMFLVAVVPSYLSYGFQATQETTETFFLALGFLFLVYALSEEENTAYFRASGLTFGAALLVSYQALYFLVPLGATVAIKYLQRDARWLFKRNLTWLISSLALIGSTPYIRNLILLRNPVYPFFSGVFPSQNFSPTIFNLTVDTWRYVAYSLVNPSNPTASGFFVNLIAYRSLYPLNAVLLIPALLLLAILPLKHKSALTIFVLIPTAFVLTSSTPFVRYFWLTLPYAAIIVARMLSSGQEALNLHVRLLKVNNQTARITRLALPILLASMLVFPAFVLLGVQNYTFVPFDNPFATGNYLNYFTNPGIPATSMLPRLYGSDVSAWSWLDQNVAPGKVAMFESRIYYMDFALRNPSSIFYLDSSYAAPLYTLNSLQSITNFLQGQNIRYIFIRSQDWNLSFLTSLGFTRFLTSPNFPLVFEDGISQVFQVGLKNDLIVSGSILAYSYHLTRSFIINGRIAENVTQNDDSPRLFVETDNALTQVNFQYLDSGNGRLDVNAYNPSSKTWVYAIATIQRHGSNQWLNSSFLVPTNYVNRYTELGLHASQDNFIVSRITTSSSTTLGRTSHQAVGQLQVSNLTSPRSMMIYLPIMNPGDILSLTTNTIGYNFTSTVFSGYIPLNQTSGWMLNHQAAATSPSSGAIKDVSLRWTATSAGIYTLVLVLTDNITNPVTINVSITIGAAS